MKIFGDDFKEKLVGGLATATELAKKAGSVAKEQATIAAEKLSDKVSEIQSEMALNEKFRKEGVGMPVTVKEAPAYEEILSQIKEQTEYALSVTNPVIMASYSMGSDSITYIDIHDIPGQTDIRRYTSEMITSVVTYDMPNGTAFEYYFGNVGSVPFVRKLANPGNKQIDEENAIDIFNWNSRFNGIISGTSEPVLQYVKSMDNKEDNN